MADEEIYSSRDDVQAVVTKDFIAALQQRSTDTSVDDVVQRFADGYCGVLSWLGAQRQDEILRAAQKATGIDLSAWLD